MDGKAAGATSAGIMAVAVGWFGGDVGVPTHPTDSQKPTIVVIGGGVNVSPKADASAETSDGDKSSGQALTDGFLSVWREDTNAGLRAKFDIEWIDDHNSAAQAAEQARSLAKNGRVLAVVGFTQSSTAAAALPYLKMAGIPVVLPIATNIELGRDPQSGKSLSGQGDHTWKLVRLIADDAYQALAIAEVMRSKKWKRVLFVREEGERVGGYVDALAYMLEKRIGSKIIAQVKLATPRDLDLLKIDVKAQKADVVCFLGYPEMGRRVLRSLGDAMEGRPPIPIIMADACARLLSEESSDAEPKAKLKSELYVTFPVKSQEEKREVSRKGEGTTFDLSKLSFEPSSRLAAVKLFECLKAQTMLSRRSLRRDLSAAAVTDYSVVHFKDGSMDIQDVQLGEVMLDDVKLSSAEGRKKLEEIRGETARRAGRNTALVGGAR